DRDPVVRLERGCFAKPDGAVLVLDAQQEQLTRGDHSRGGHERLPKRQREPCQAAPHVDIRIPMARRIEYRASSFPVPASAAFSEGASLCVPTVRTSGTAIGIASSVSTMNQVRPPAVAITIGARNA